MMEPILLASASPRRTEILKTIRIPHEIKPSPFDESTVSRDCSPTDYVKTLAFKKAESILCEELHHRYILAADTVVVLDGHIMGKPTDATMVREHLTALSGKKHYVYTGICLYNPEMGLFDTRVCETRVTMSVLDTDDIEFYIGTKEPFGKAGSYAIQGIGARYIESIQGDFYNVVGLPVHMTLQLLKENGYMHI